MIEPFDIAVAAHRHCEEVLIPKGVSPAHDITMHAFSTAAYAEAFNAAGMEVSGEEIVQAILDCVGWDMESPWPGHPPPDKVISWLNRE